MKTDTSPSWKKKRSVFDRTERSICDECGDSGPVQKSTVPFWIPSDEKDMVPLVRPSATQLKWSEAHRAVSIFKGKWNQAGILQEGWARGGHHGGTQHSEVKTANKSYRGCWEFIGLSLCLPIHSPSNSYEAGSLKELYVNKAFNTQALKKC